MFFDSSVDGQVVAGVALVQRQESFFSALRKYPFNAQPRQVLQGPRKGSRKRETVCTSR
jgi:hypothetical protein